MTQVQVRFSPMVATVWAAVETLGKDLHWSVEDLMGLHPEVIPSGANNPARSVGKCMTTLLQHGRVKVVGRAREVGSPKGCNLYQRTPAKCWSKPKPLSTREKNMDQPEPKRPVTQSKTVDGITHVRFGQGWTPHHPENCTLALRGYQSSLAGV